MIRRLIVLALLVGAAPVAVEGQSSQFGVSGLGLPVRPFSPRAIATGGGFGLFDVESSLNPASIGGIIQFTALLTTTQNFRSSTNPFGSSSGRDARFPQVIAAGPIGGTRLAVAFSASGYTDRSFALGTQDSIDLRGQRVGVFDTLSSRGGLTDLRGAVAWNLSRTFQLGLGLHAITGTNRVENRRTFSDSSYVPAVERADISYLGMGVSGGFTWRVVPRLTLAGMYRNDGHLNVERDSIRIGRTDLPQAISVGVRFQPTLKLGLAGSYTRRNWSSADDDLKAQGGLGSDNVYEIAGGLELLRDPKNPTRRPWRLGAHYETLPFPVQVGRQPHQFGVALGTGVRFTQGRGGFDVALEQLWRSDGGAFTEHATVVTIGVSIRP
jgi:hypothetical protein